MPRYKSYKKKPNIEEIEHLSSDLLSQKLEENEKNYLKIYKIENDIIKYKEQLDILEKKIDATSKNEIGWDEYFERQSNIAGTILYTSIGLAVLTTFIISFSVSDIGLLGMLVIASVSFLIFSWIGESIFDETDIREIHKKYLKNPSDKIMNIQKEIFSINRKIEKCNSTIYNLKPDYNDEELKYARKKSRAREKAARLAAFESKARQGTQSLKKQLLRKVTGKSKKCIYCGKSTLKQNLVLDHIHPIAKGGQTVIQNSVLVCQSCNSTKSALTLRAFCKKAGHNFDEVTSRLEKQGKWV